MEEFNLIKKRKEQDILQFGDPIGIEYIYYEKDVKEFIKKKNDLNEEIVRAYLDTYLCKERKFRLLRDGILGEMKEKGNKLAGDKFVSQGSGE